MGKRFTESAAKKAAGNARKVEQAAVKRKAEIEALEVLEASKWEQGSRKPSQKQLLEEEKRKEKAKAKQERAALLIAEEEQLGKGGKGKKK